MAHQSLGAMPKLPALRGGAPRAPMGGESLTDSLTALLTKPNERSERAKQLLARQPLLASHPIVSGGMPYVHAASAGAS